MQFTSKMGPKYVTASSILSGGWFPQDFGLCQSLIRRTEVTQKTKKERVGPKRSLPPRYCESTKQALFHCNNGRVLYYLELCCWVFQLHLFKPLTSRYLRLLPWELRCLFILVNGYCAKKNGSIHPSCGKIMYITYCERIWKLKKLHLTKF